MPRIGSSGNGGSNSTTSTPTIPELLADPVSPSPGDTWVLRYEVKGSPIGLLLAITYPTNLYKLSYMTTEGDIIRTPLT